MVANSFFEQQKVCPICQTKFKVTRVRSSACFVMARDTDFHVKYRDIDPLLYSIWVCPNCQYANVDKDFDEDFRPHELDRLKKGLPLLKSDEPELSGDRTPQTALKAVELALRTAMVRQAPSIALAGLFLRGAWLYRDLGKADEEKKFLEQAKKLYQQSYEKEWGRMAAKMSDSRIMYLIGELYRRLGDNEEAIKWFSRTVMNKDIKNQPELNRLVRDQWEYAREEYKKQQADNPGQPAGGTSPAMGQETEEAMESDQQAAVPVIAQPKSRGSKVKMFLNLYMDQIDWLKNSSNKVYDKHKIFLEKEVIVRALIDALMEKYPDLGEFKSEEELKTKLLERFSTP